MTILTRAEVAITVAGKGRALAYAKRVLELLGVEFAGHASNKKAVLLQGGNSNKEAADYAHVVRLWDFQVGTRGIGLQASAASGVSWVMGFPGKPPIGLPLDIPEKWCGLLGVSIALATIVNGARSGVRPEEQSTFDVSAADVTHSFAVQNFANHKEIPDGWRRNGRSTPQHGGIYPQGFYPCRDGFVAMVARSKLDWARILNALDDPPWATGDFKNPFHLARDSHEADMHLQKTLAAFTREELLDRARKAEATMAPVFSASEAADRGIGRIVRETGLPFILKQRELAEPNLTSIGKGR